MARSWLSQGAEELVRQCAESAGGDFDCDVLIVGSGYGGAVAAARLAGRSVRDPDESVRKARVWLLERGLEHLPGQFPSRFSELAGHIRFSTPDAPAPRGRPEGLFDLRLGTDVSVLLGNGLGGGSLINASVMERPAESVFDEGWPQDIAHDALDVHFRRVEAMLDAQPIPRDREPRKLQAFDRLARAEVERCTVAVRWDRAPRQGAVVQQHACTLCGDCLTGCNQGAKGSLDTNYLAAARAAGAQLFCGGAVESLQRAPSFGWTVDWHYTDPARRRDGGFKIRARNVILAAGSLGSTEILMRSRDKHGLELSEACIGRRFSTNGDAIVAVTGNTEDVNATSDEETDPALPGSRNVGPTITGMLRVEATDEHPAFVIEELAVPGALKNVFGETLAALAALERHDLPGGDRFAITSSLIEHASLYALIGDDKAKGTLQLPERLRDDSRAVEGVVQIHWDSPRPSLLDAMQRWSAPKLTSEKLLPGKNFGPLLSFLPGVTVHPLGGCAMADDIDHGVVNAWGQVYRSGSEVHRGLAVLDGAIVPRALGVNPALTIAALAENGVAKLAEQWHLLPTDSAPEPLPERPLAPRRALPAAYAVWRIEERIRGIFARGDQRYRAELDLVLEEIAGFRETLMQSGRVVGIEHARLRLWPERADANDTESFGDDAPACTAQLSGVARFFVPMPLGADRDPRVTLCYEMRVDKVVGDPAPIAVDDELEAIKTLGPTPDLAWDRDRGIWRQLTEMDVRCQGTEVGVWRVDLEEFVRRGRFPLRLVRTSSMPDALADLASLVLYVFRYQLQWLLDALEESFDRTPKADHLPDRVPREAENGASEVLALGSSGARLARYRAPRPANDLPPILLIHGLGGAGTTFTHASIGRNLLDFLQDEGRDVWVVDLTSSIANDAGRADPGSAEWTVDDIAHADIPRAVNEVLARTQAPQIDVFAHCMGAVMFCCAALGTDALVRKIRSAVLSQATPLVHPSPLNRVRGYVASYLAQYLRVSEFDTCPEFRRVETEGDESWELIEPRALSLHLVDALLATFPYPAEDREWERFEQLPDSDFRRKRHRADAMFGQLFELDNVSDDVLGQLEALLGWVKVPMLAQALHFLSEGILTDPSGHNVSLHRQNFELRFGFPVLMLHGERNAVFDWRGSLESWKLIRRLRGASEESLRADVRSMPWGRLFGAETDCRLAVFKEYGHLDCVIGHDAHAHVFPVVADFHAAISVAPPEGITAPSADADAKIQAEAPRVGPMLGAIAREQTSAEAARFHLKMILHPESRRARTLAVAIVPLDDERRPLLDEARQLVWPGGRHAMLVLRFAPERLENGSHAFAVVTLHDDLPLPSLDARLRMRALPLEAESWLVGSQPVDEPLREVLRQWFEQAAGSAALEQCVFHLPSRVLAAADRGAPVEAATDRLCFALGSCQYPPGLVDETPAAASYRLLHEEAERDRGPQFLLLVGDQVYVDETAGLFHPSAPVRRSSGVLEGDFDRIYERTWRLGPFRRTTARLPVLPLLDDHEVGDNWPGMQGASPITEEINAALSAYERFQGALAPDARIGGNGSHSYRYFPGGVPFYFLDTRRDRDPRTEDNIGRAQILRSDVMDALCAELAAEGIRESVKFIVSPTPLLPPEAFGSGSLLARLRSDTWSGYPASTARLLRWIRYKCIRRVVLLAGDSHLSSVSTFTFEDCDNRIISVVSSGLYTPWPFANQQATEIVTQGTVDFALPGESEHCRGTIDCEALSSASGYAVLTLERDGATPTLKVSLRSADAQTQTVHLSL